MVLETVQFRHHHVAALILSHLDLPLPGGGGGEGVDIDVDLVTLGGGWDIHVLAGVVATDGGGHSSSRVGDCQGVVDTVSNSQTDCSHS